MDIVKSIRKGQEKGNFRRDVLFNKLEFTVRQFPEIINKKIADAIKVTILLGRYLHFYDDTHHHKPDLFEKPDALKIVYQRLNNQLGEESYVGEWYTVDQACIDQFAQVTGDQQWIHTDPSRAKNESPFKTTIAHGFLTLALVPLLTGSTDPKNNLYPEARMVVNCGLNHVVFPYPVKAGKRIRARTRVIKLVPMKRGLEVIREVRVEIENSKRAACITEAVLRLYF